ncbi:chitosanase [Streptomyces sp. NPDC050560]|uniref:chitosanase n=1 Tax=Streptomyces sp. NPDC050560 TaxID=3365630 RepID=UPI0037B95992
MKRVGCLFLAVAPIATVLVFLFGSGSESGDAQDGASSARHGSGGGSERSKDDAAVARMPPGLAAPGKKEIAQEIVASAENSTLDWKGQYGYIEDIGDGQGYTAGIIGFCTGTHDLLTLVRNYTDDHPDNGLAKYLPALRKVDGSDSHEGLDPGFPDAWRREAGKPAFDRAQERERDEVYFDPAVRQGKLDGLSTLGQFIYYDAMVLHGPGTSGSGFYALVDRAKERADSPDEGGDEEKYLAAFLDVGEEAMKERRADIDTSRIDTAQRRFLDAGNFGLDKPLKWKVYGESYDIT